MRHVLQPVRFLAVIASILLYLVATCVVWLMFRERWRRVRAANVFLQYVCKYGLWLLNVKVNPTGLENVASVTNALYVGNHLSYLDVLVISSKVPSCFVTSKEIKETPALGQICVMSGCLFVERRNKMNIHNEVSEISEGLKSGVNVAIFPEATSTNGEQILRFRKPLYVAAITAAKPILPFCLNYRSVGGKEINLKTRDSVFWYGDMAFAPHLWALAGSGGVEVDLNFLPPLWPAPNDDATLLAQQSQQMVENVFRPVKNDNEGAMGAPSLSRI